MTGEIMDVEFITDEHLEVDLGEIAGSSIGGGTTVISVKANYNQTNPNADDYIIGRENIVGKEDLASVTEEILAEAKASGEFDGKDGYSPIRGTDYWTDADKAEMVSAVVSALPKYDGEVVSA
jgi:hypothetical protein